MYRGAICCELRLTTFGVSVVSAEAAQHVHNAVNDVKKTAPGAYKPKCFTVSEYKTLQRLADLIVPADEKSKGALDAGAPEFIDSCPANARNWRRFIPAGSRGSIMK